jgi:hypothetical protein
MNDETSTSRAKRRDVVVEEKTARRRTGRTYESRASTRRRDDREVGTRGDQTTGETTGETRRRRKRKREGDETT